MNTIPNIKELEKNDLITIEKKVTVNGEGAEIPYLEVERKRFDPNTGEAIDPEVQTLNPKGLQEQLDNLETAKANLELQIANVKLLLSKLK